MRGLGLAFLLLAALGAAQTPRREGTYRPEGGKPVSWRIDEGHNLVWNGERYAPVGASVQGATGVEEAVAAGVKDLLIDVKTAGDEWAAPVASAEKAGARYLVRVADAAPGATGISVDPAAYRVAGLRGGRHFDIDLPGATSALVLVALKRDSTAILSHTLVPAKEGRVSFDTKVNADLENVVLVYPFQSGVAIPDLWEGMDGHRDLLLSRLRRAGFGAGLRGLVDPLGSGSSLPGRDLRAVPTSASFQAELAETLERKNKTVANVLAAWSLSASSLSTYVTAGQDGKGTLKTSFGDLSRMVPLWSGERGVPFIYDPGKDKLYPCDRVRAQIWTDIGETVALAASRRMERLCAAIRSVVDVPVVQEWDGWSGATETAEPAIDGMAARVAGEGSNEIVNSAARAVSSVARWTTRGWLVATDVDVPAKDLDGTLDGLANLGLRAAFVRAPLSVAATAGKVRAANPLPDFPLDPVFFPENAANPAAVQRLPGNRWWLPTPEDGNRLDLGTLFFGYRMATARGPRVVMWARVPGRYLLRVVKPELMTVTSLDNSDPDPRKAKGGVLVTMTQMPIVIEGLNEIPIPDLAAKETIDTYARLLAMSEDGRHVGTDETYAFSQAATGLEYRPDGAYFAMREQLRRFAGLLSPVAWVEAESSKDTTFSEAAPIPGASDDQALVLRSLLPPADGYVANYDVPVASRGEVVLWVAARLAPERRRELEVALGGQTLVAGEAPVSAYGAGFAWYRMGSTRLTGNLAKVQLRMHSGAGAEAAFDALVFAPPTWRPDGVAYPYEEIVKR